MEAWKKFRYSYNKRVYLVQFSFDHTKFVLDVEKYVFHLVFGVLEGDNLEVYGREGYLL